MIGNNLGSHFSPSVIKENNIYLTPLPPDSTHLMQPLDIFVFPPVKRMWRDLLNNWRKESRSNCSIPKEHFSVLLSKLWITVNTNEKENLISGFRGTGFCPFKPKEVLRKLPDNKPDRAANSEAMTKSLFYCKKWGVTAQKRLFVNVGNVLNQENALRFPKTKTQNKKKKRNGDRE